MSREKKTKTGINGDLVFARKHNRTNAEMEGRERKKQKKRKGLKSGSRHSDGSSTSQGAGTQVRDPRLGSKKKIPLVVETNKKASKQARRLDAEQELKQLENDAQLNVLLDRLDNGEKLGAGLQKYVDEKLDRIETLMTQLGLLVEETEEEVEAVAVPTKSERRKPASDDDLLAQFETLDLDDYKG
ncbi:Der GTPase-activating protein YihI [Vibrio fujianensis]|uniref:Der GTPase-activating protein YihI n=1 Tax=Vibrio fujianensis TaxID=1974215 RepID=UPI000C1720C3|nr:Der GTPase-activating protein YihI [Vibrio fujianensis]